MSDLINRQDAIDQLHQSINLLDAEQRLNDMPSVEWKVKWKTAHLDHVSIGIRPKVLYCSECDQCIAYPTNFCPNCGAKNEFER